jgi:hypothetical protein
MAGPATSDEVSGNESSSIITNEVYISDHNRFIIGQESSPAVTDKVIQAIRAYQKSLITAYQQSVIRAC